MESTNTVVIGASAAGLAVAACLKRRGLDAVLLERSDNVGSAWRSHYERLHLHTNRANSGLPYYPMPRDYPRYPSRLQVVEYLEAYRDHHGLRPRYEEEVTEVRRADNGWVTATGRGTYRSQNVVLATGYTHSPIVPSWAGTSAYRGDLMHSSRYRNGDPWKGEQVLVVGFGNSACEIAIDLCERGAHPSIAVRGPVNIIPRDFLGIPILSIGIVLKPLPARLADFLAKPIIATKIGDFTKLGLRRLPYGPNSQVRREGRIPLLDIGTVALIKKGAIQVRPGIERFTEKGVLFTDGEERNYAAVILATGYRPSLAPLGPLAERLCDEKGLPGTSGRETDLPGLFLCGYYVSPTGMLREIKIESKRIAHAIAKRNQRGNRRGRS